MNKYKQIGLVIALEDECLSVLSKIGHLIKEYNIGNLKISHFKKNNKDIFLCVCGIGEISSSIATTLLINKFNVELIINFGLCGSLKKTFKKGDVVYCNEIVHYDYSLDTCNPEKEGIYIGRDSFVFNVPNTLDFSNNELNLRKARIASGDKFISSTDLKNHIIERYNCDICDMESAGINLSCETFSVDRIFIKSVSDNADENADVSFKDVIDNGVNTYVHIIEKILEN